MIWWISAIALVIIIAVALILIRPGRPPAEPTSLAQIRRMDWRQFEFYLGDLFRSLGYQAEVTQASGDFGVDVVVIHPNGTRIAVQAKHWRSEYVGAPDVLKTAGGALYYGCQQAIVVTTSGYTDQAREAARGTGVELWGPQELTQMIAQAHGQTPPAPAIQQTLPRPAAALPASAPAPRPGRPTCPKCRAPMEPKIAFGQPIWLCSHFPYCNGSLMRDVS